MRLPGLDNAKQLRPHLYGLGYPGQPSLRVTLAEATFSVFLCKIQPTVYIKERELVSGGETTRVGVFSLVGK